MSIALEGIAKRYRRTTALADVNFTTAGGVTALLGPNGAGKTTLMRIVATGLRRSAGSVRVLGHDPSRSSGRLAIRRNLGYVPQSSGIPIGITPFAYLDYVAVLKEIDERRRRHDEVRRVLDLLELSGVAHRPVRTLSGGARARVLLAQALLGDPRVLVLDEPTAGLDPEQRMRFRALVSPFAGDRTVLLSTHATDDVVALSDHVVVLDGGTVRFDGTPAELTARADGRVWVTTAPDPRAQRSWRTGEGHYRNLGRAPSGATTVAATLEDGYLCLVAPNGT